MNKRAVALADAAAARADALGQQVVFEVFSSYHALQTATRRVRTSDDSDRQRAAVERGGAGPVPGRTWARFWTCSRHRPRWPMREPSWFSPAWSGTPRWPAWPTIRAFSMHRAAARCALRRTP